MSSAVACDVLKQCAVDTLTPSPSEAGNNGGIALGPRRPSKREPIRHGFQRPVFAGSLCGLLGSYLEAHGISWDLATTYNWPYNPTTSFGNLHKAS